MNIQRSVVIGDLIQNRTEVSVVVDSGGIVVVESLPISFVGFAKDKRPVDGCSNNWLNVKGIL